MSKRYKISILEFEGEGEDLKAQSLYEQTVEALNIKKVIEAVNADAPLQIQPFKAVIRKRAPRSDRGKKRKAVINVGAMPV